MRMAPSTPVTKPPTLACHARTRPDSGRGLGAGRRRALADRDRQRRVRRLARQQLQLTLELFDLGLNGIQLVLHGQDVTHGVGLGQDGEVLLAAGRQRGNARLQVDVLAGDVSGLGREVRRLAEGLGAGKHRGETLYRHLECHAARGGASARLRLRVGHEAAVGTGQRGQLRDRPAQLVASDGQGQRTGLFDFGGLSDGAVRQVRRARRRRRYGVVLHPLGRTRRLPRARRGSGAGLRRPVGGEARVWSWWWRRGRSGPARSAAGAPARPRPWDARGCARGCRPPRPGQKGRRRRRRPKGRGGGPRRRRGGAHGQARRWSTSPSLPPSALVAVHGAAPQGPLQNVVGTGDRRLEGWPRHRPGARPGGRRRASSSGGLLAARCLARRRRGHTGRGRPPAAGGLRAGGTSPCPGAGRWRAQCRVRSGRRSSAGRQGRAVTAATAAARPAPSRPPRPARLVSRGRCRVPARGPAARHRRDGRGAGSRCAAWNSRS